MAPALFATSDLHIGYRENLAVVDGIRPASDDDWLIVAGDVAEHADAVIAALALLAQRFARVIWTPGNHELWTMPNDPVQLRGVRRYEHLVARCREIDVLTPEDPYPAWSAADGDEYRIAPLFLLYDYSFRIDGVQSKQASLAAAYEAGVVCTDERFLDPDPYPTREQWCWDRVASTERRLVECDPAVPLVLVNHWPLRRDPTRLLRHQVFAQWCGTDLSSDWHTRFNTAVAVYGHLHIPRTSHVDGVRFEEVSLGYPREWTARKNQPIVPRRLLG